MKKSLLKDLDLEQLASNGVDTEVLKEIVEDNRDPFEPMSYLALTSRFSALHNERANDRIIYQLEVASLAMEQHYGKTSEIAAEFRQELAKFRKGDRGVYGKVLYGNPEYVIESTRRYSA